MDNDPNSLEKFPEDLNAELTEVTFQIKNVLSLANLSTFDFKDRDLYEDAQRQVEQINSDLNSIGTSLTVEQTSQQIAELKTQLKEKLEIICNTFKGPMNVVRNFAEFIIRINDGNVEVEYQIINSVKTVQELAQALLGKLN